MTSLAKVKDPFNLGDFLFNPNFYQLLEVRDILSLTSFLERLFDLTSTGL